jgi:urease subunit beta
MLPGEGSLELHPGRETTTLTVSNTGDRPVQVGSHFHLFEANRALRFDRAAAYGVRLAVPSGTAVRFEPGDEHEVETVPIAGRRVMRGMNGLVQGELDDPLVRERAIVLARERGFLDTGGSE